MTIKKKKWSWAGHIMHRKDKRRTNSNGMATKKFQEKPGEAKNQVERRNSSILRCKMELTNIRERWKGLGKAFVLQWTSNG